MVKVRVFGTTLLALLALSLVAAPATVANGRPLKAELTGASVVPGPGDPDGSGAARLRLNQGRERICYRITVDLIAQPTSAHIHVGTADVVGPVVVPLTAAFVDGVAEGCETDVDRALIKDIRKNRANYYVDVHNAEFPGGAVRGQLEKWAPGRP